VDLAKAEKALKEAQWEKRGKKKKTKCGFLVGAIKTNPGGANRGKRGTVGEEVPGSRETGKNPGRKSGGVRGYGRSMCKEEVTVG